MANVQEQLTIPDAERIIKSFIDRNVTLTDVEKFFNTKYESDTRIVTTLYTELLLNALPRKSGEYILKMFENCDENQILEWIDVVFGVKQNILILLKDEEIYKCIEEVQRRQPNIDFSLIDKEIRAIFRSLFVDCLNFKGIIEIYRILLYCETHTKCSTVYWKAVTELWKKLGNENSLNLTKNKKATIYPEHESLLELVKSYEECQCEIVKDLIKNLFKTSVTVVCKCKTNSEKIEARGYTIYLSTINDKIEELMNDEIREIEINAQEDIIFDQDIYLPGKNLILIAKNRLVFLNPQVCNLSGKMAENDILISPQIGRKMGEDGLDGKDGKAGQSSGNILISAKTIEGKDNLKISLNGGNGSDGQDGGDGVDGEDGKGKDFDTVFGWAYTFSKGIKYLTLGAVPRMLDNTLREKVDKSGANHITSDSAYYLLTHTIELYGGSDGKLGGRGGINGCGGEGGKKGSYDILINGERCDNIFEICAQNGKDGRRGKPGQNGRMGLDGWDIALTAKAFGDRQEFGKMKNEKLRIIYSDYRSPDSVYVKEKDKGIGSQCYAKIISSPCERKILRDQQVEVKTDSERSAEACATKSKPIDIEAISQQQLTTAQVINVENEEEQNANSEIERYHETGRIMDFYKPLEIDNYVFKQRHHTPIIIDEKLEDIEKNWEEFWSSCAEREIKNLINKKNLSPEISLRLKKKQVVNKLRDLKMKIERKPINNDTSDMPKKEIMDEEYAKSAKLLYFLEKLNFDGKSISFYAADIKQIFQNTTDDKAIEEITKWMQKISSLSEDAKLLMSDLTFSFILEEYNKLGENVKKLECLPLFCYFQLLEWFLIDDSIPSQLDENDRRKDYYLLQKQRRTYSMKFVEKFNKKQEKYGVGNFFTLIGAFEDNSSINDSLTSKINALFSFPSIKSTKKHYLFKKLMFLCKKFPAIGVTFLNALILVFEVEGCHIDLITLKYLIGIVFDECKNTRISNCYLFPVILLSTKQENWIDEFFVFHAESTFQCLFRNKKDIIQALEKVEDENMKILCTEKLDDLIKFTKTKDEGIEKLMKILEEIKTYKTLYFYFQDIPLTEWTTIMQQIHSSYGIKNNEWEALSSTSKTFVLFWCNKIAEKFGASQIKTSLTSIIEMSTLQKVAKNKIGRYMQRLCSNDCIYNISESNLNDILQAAIHCISMEKPLSNASDCYKAAKELLNDNENCERNQETLKALFDNLNDDKKFSNIEQLLRYDDSCTKYIDACVKDLIQDKTITNFEHVKKKIEEYYESCEPKMDLDAFYVEIVDNMISKLKTIKLRTTQKIAIFYALKNSNGILQQISTGEGKTLIIASVSIINALKGISINIVTSSSVLAKRDVSDSPNGCQSLYKAFKIEANHICFDSIKDRTKSYSQCKIIYGDLGSYQRDYLLDKFYSMDIATCRAPGIIIVDEVDSLLLDNGLNTLYLSHEIAELEMLHSLMINIWNLVNCQIKNEDSCDSEEFYQKVYQSFFPKICWETLTKLMGINETKAERLKCFLIDMTIIDQHCNVLVSKEKMRIQFKMILNNFHLLSSNHFENIFKSSYCSDQLVKEKKISKAEVLNFNYMLMLTDFNHPLKKENDKDSLKENLESMEKEFEALLSYISAFHIEVPDHLQSYVKRHLREFIINAENAFHLEEGVSYQVDITTNSSFKPKIIIIDRDTGVDLPTTQWHKGLHQFLQLKHGLNLTALSTKAVFISNVSYLKKFKAIYGFSGTLGAKDERKQLDEIYGLKTITLPSSHSKLFYEEHSIVTKTRESHIEEIYLTIKMKLKEDRSVLIIADSYKQVTELHENIKLLAEEEKQKSNTLSDDLFKAFDNSTVYKRDSEQFAYGNGEKKLETKSIIFATTLAGRGTDIRLTEELKSNGGLHVIIAFLPRNIRIEEQAYGRSARCGEAGTAQLIVYDPNSQSNANILELKWKRDRAETKRIQSIIQHYESKIKTEEQCFMTFCNVFQKLTSDMKENQYTRILSKDLLDRWALWLDEAESKWFKKEDCAKQSPMFQESVKVNTMVKSFVGKCIKESRVKEAKKFCEELPKINEKNTPTRPLNILNYGVNKSIEGKYDEAKVLFTTLLDNYPIYSPEAKYYLVFLISKTKENLQQYERAKKILEEAKKEFTDRILNIEDNIKIVETHKIVEECRIFVSDAFVQQQQDAEQSIRCVTESIDRFFGQSIEWEDFIYEEFDEIAALFIYHSLRNPKHFGTNLPLTNFKIKDKFENGLKIYCKDNGLSLEVVSQKLKNKNEYEMEELQKIMDIPTWENFWNELKEENLITHLESHVYINSSKIPKLIESKIELCRCDERTENAIFEHSFLEGQHWYQLDDIKLKENFDDELIEFLKQCEIFTHCETGKLVQDIPEKINFKNFCTITKENLLFYGLSKKIVDEIIDTMVAENLLNKSEGNIYELSSSFTITKCYEMFSMDFSQIVIKMIKQKMAFALAYLNIQKNLPQILGPKNDSAFVFNLKEYGILEVSNINLKALKYARQSTSITRKIWEGYWETIECYNIAMIILEADKFIKEKFQRNLFANKIAGKNLLYNFDVKRMAERIKLIFYENAPIQQKSESFDIYLTLIDQPQHQQQQRNNDAFSQATTHGLKYLINFSNKKWTKKTKIHLSCITAAAIGQVIAGGAMLVGGAGIGIVPAKILIFEGIGDLIFAAKGAYNGQCGNYMKHKATNLAINASFCSFADYVSVAKNLSPFYQEGIVAVKNAGNKSELLFNASINLLKHVSTSIAKIVFNQIDDAKQLADLIMKSIQTIVTKMIEKTSDIVENFFSNPSIKDLIDAIKTSLRCKGITYQTVINGIAKQIFDKDIDPLFFKIGIYIVTEFKKLISNENIVNQNSPSNNKAQQLLNGIEKILTSEIFKNFMVLLQAKLKAIEKQLIKRCKNELLEDVQSKEGVDISLDKASIFKVDENQMFTETVENAMTQWSNELKEKTKDAFETKVKLVLNSANEKNFQSKLNSIILGAYADFRKDQKKRSEIGKKIQKIPSNLAEENLMIQFKKDYFFKLGELQTKTCNPSHYVAAILETANIDEYGGNVISQLISEKLYKTVIVKNEDKFIKPDEIIITPNDIDDYMFHENIDVFSQLMQSQSELANIFETNEIFENILTQQIENDFQFYDRHQTSHFDNK